jgi:hypothetical protein
MRAGAIRGSRRWCRPDHDGGAAPLGHGDRHDLVGEDAGVPGDRGPSVRLRAEPVLCHPAEWLFVVLALGQQAHRLRGEGVLEPVDGHVVDHGDVAELRAEPGAPQEVRGLAHRLLAARDDHPEVAGADELVGHDHGLDAREADLAHRGGGDAHRDAARHRGLSCRQLPGPGGQHLPHDHIFHVRGGDAGLLQRTGDRHSAEFRRREPRQSAEQLSDRRSRAGDDD